MATHSAIAAVSEAVIQLLRTSYQAADFDQMEIDFKVYMAQDFATSMQAGVSLCLYRVTPNTVLRNLPGRLAGGKSRKPALPVDLHLLVTVWAMASIPTYTKTAAPELGRPLPLICN